MLAIQNEKGRPVAAALGVTVLKGGKGKTSRPSGCGPDLLHALLLEGDFDSPAALEGIDLNLSDADVAAQHSTLVLGCQETLAAGKAGDPSSLRRKKASHPRALR